MMTRVNGLLRKTQHPVKRARLMMTMRANGLLRKKWHAPVARCRGTLPWHAPVARARPRAQAPAVTKSEILMENTFTNGLRLKT